MLHEAVENLCNCWFIVHTVAESLAVTQLADIAFVFDDAVGITEILLFQDAAAGVETAANDTKSHDLLLSGQIGEDRHRVVFGLDGLRRARYRRCENDRTEKRDRPLESTLP